MMTSLDRSRGLDDVIFRKVPISNFCEFCIAKEFSNFHCIFNKVKWFVCFFI